jgi:hypothetical protein
LTDAQWGKLEPLLNPPRAGNGRGQGDEQADRAHANGVLPSGAGS